jgi:uncharacterized protein
MIRVVLDTNVLVSALLHPGGPPALVFLKAIEGRSVRLCVSGDVYAEYEEVIQRPRLKRSKEEVASALAAIREAALWVKAERKVRACLDPDDDIFLECAEAAQAHFLVTGNLKDFPADWADTGIVAPRQFLDVLAEIQDEPPQP